jgi:hypothetical protein
MQASATTSSSDEYAIQGSGRELPPVRGSKAAGKKKKAPSSSASSSSPGSEAAAAAAAAEKAAAEKKEAAAARAARTPSSHVYDAPDYFRKWCVRCKGGNFEGRFFFLSHSSTVVSWYTSMHAC